MFFALARLGKEELAAIFAYDEDSRAAIWMKEPLTLMSPASRLPGIGQTTQEALEAIGIRTVGDVLNCYPKEYRDFSTPKPIGEAVLGKLDLYEGYVCERAKMTTAKNGARVLNFRVGDRADDPFARVTVFNQQYLLPNLRGGIHVFVYGEPGEYGARLSFSSPQVFFKRPQEPIQAIYSLPKNITQPKMRRAITYALNNVDIPETFSNAFLEHFGLVRRSEAYRLIHTPQNMDQPEVGMRRFHIEECLVNARVLDSIAAKGRMPNLTPVDAEDYLQDFYSLLPFVPTGGQKRAMQDIAHDLESSFNMNRLIQGDVGSGKTIVALFGAYCLMRNGYDAYLLVPTEVLARQHAAAAASILGPKKVVCLTGQMRTRERRDLEERVQLARGALIVGTHALLYGDVPLGHPGIVIADEQHRFGVRQRQKLLAKAETMHSITMSATPIPRSLALAVHGQTNVSVIDELPPGRQPIQTSYVKPSKVNDMYGFIAKRAKEGKQAYIVCPAIEENETMPMRSACQTYEMLKERFPDIGVGLLHGRCSADEKEETMRAFAHGDLQVLVATTVIEVGVDVPNASVMVILDAERFGLAQLHQLRGRVGRGTELSYCFLTTNHKEALSRVSVLCRTNNGFEIAEEDLKERGAGDFLGERQHGTTGILSLLTEGNERTLEYMRDELSAMSTDARFAQDFELITRLAQRELDTKLDELALN